MVTLAIAATAGMVQAASMSWGFGGKVYLSTDGETAAISAYKVAGSSPAEYVINPDASKFAGTKLALVYLGQNKTSVDFAAITESMVVDTMDFAITGSGVNVGKFNPATQAYKFGEDDYSIGASFAVVFYDGKGYSSAYALSGSDAVGSAINPTITTLDVAEKLTGELSIPNTFLTGGSSTVGVLVAQSVPEPTSGLLLLFGMAGLALRRRRA